METYLSTGDAELHLAAVSAHEGRELVADTLKGTQTVVLGESVEEVLEDAILVSTGNLLELLNDLLLVGLGEGRGVQDGGELGVLLESLVEVGKSLGGRVESGGLNGSSVL